MIKLIKNYILLVIICLPIVFVIDTYQYTKPFSFKKEFENVKNTYEQDFIKIKSFIKGVKTWHL